MGLILKGGARVDCDGLNDGKKCRQSFNQCGRAGFEALAEEALNHHWIYNSGTDKWYCPQCAQSAKRR